MKVYVVFENVFDSNANFWKEDVVCVIGNKDDATEFMLKHENTFIVEYDVLQKCQYLRTDDGCKWCEKGFSVDMMHGFCIGCNVKNG